MAARQQQQIESQQQASYHRFVALVFFVLFFQKLTLRDGGLQSQFFIRTLCLLQMLVAKEQRVKFLKQQEQRHQQIAAENERLQRLRERVEAQEMKLQKLRALRGQVDQQKINNSSLSTSLIKMETLAGRSVLKLRTRRQLPHWFVFLFNFWLQLQNWNRCVRCSMRKKRNCL